MGWIVSLLPQIHVKVLNIGICGRAIILLTTGLSRESQSTVICLTLSWDCIPYSSYTISEAMDWTTGLLLTNTPKAREQTPNSQSLCRKHDPAFSAPHIQESIPVFLKLRSLSTRVSILGCLWKFPVLLSQQGPLIPSMRAWLGAADLESSPFSPALLLVHFSRGTVHTAPSSQKPNKLLPYLYSLGTLYRPSEYSFVLQMFTVDLLDYVLFIFSPEWLYNFSISTLGDV